MNQHVALLFTLVGVLQITPGSAGESYSGYWRQVTKGRTESRECHVVRSDSALREDLRAIAWDMAAYPDVNWATDEAVVIAPSRGERGEQIALYDVRLTDSSVVVEWGWAQWTADLGKVTIVGAGDSPQAIVVSFRRATGSVQCPVVED
jgi:hypothetical protein